MIGEGTLYQMSTGDLPEAGASRASRQGEQTMRINNKEIQNANISVVSQRKVQGLKGLKAIFTYEARVKKKGRTYKKQSEDLGFLQNWLLSQLEAA